MMTEYIDIRVNDKGDPFVFEAGTEEAPNLVIIATPITEIANILGRLAELQLSNLFVVEIGSTKGMWEFYCHMAGGGYRFEMLHPMVGPLADWNEKDWGKTCLCVSGEGDILPETKSFWEELGFEIKFIDPDEHDRVIGKLSHLSHLMILKYVDFIESTMTKEEIALAGTSFEKFKEMAVGARRLDDIYKTNMNLPEIAKEFSEFLKK